MNRTTFSIYGNCYKEHPVQSHLLVLQLRFARSEFVRCLEGVSAEDTVRQMMGHAGVHEFVGDIYTAVYWPEDH